MDKVDFTSLEQYQPYHAARADMFKRAQQFEAACESYGLAISYSQNAQEKSYLEKQLKQLEQKRC